jgi:predicted amidohydrolase YtcJ
LRFASTLVLSAFLVLGTACSERVVYRGGPVLTVDAENRVVEALGVEDGRIAAVGSEADVLAWAGSSPRIVELDGRALVPGFVDAHGHFPGEGVWARVADLNPPPIGDVERLAQLEERLGELADETPDGEWVIGMGYDDTLLAEKRHPTREDLDRVSTTHPVGILHISGHLAVANSRALEIMGYGPDTPDPEGGVLQRDAEGAPNGVLEENAMEPLQAVVFDMGALDALSVVLEAVDRYAAQGVTTAQVGYAPASQIGIFPLLARVGLLPIRLVIWPGMEALDEALEKGEDFSSSVPDRVRIGAVKLIGDGSIQGYTGYLSEPYHVPPGDDPAYRGYPRIPKDELAERVKRYHDAGYQIAVHGNGDASIDDILDAYEAVIGPASTHDARPIVIHAQMAREDQLDRMKQLGVVPSFFSLHTYYWGDRHRDIFMGPERAARMSPARSARDKGVRFTIHCDSPVVPVEPLRLIWSAVNRLSSSGAEIGPDQRITPAEALRAVTIDAAWQHREEALKGSLEPGKLADLVILSASPLDDPATIDQIRVLETIVGGETVYRADD